MLRKWLLAAGFEWLGAKIKAAASAGAGWYVVLTAHKLAVSIVLGALFAGVSAAGPEWAQWAVGAAGAAFASGNIVDASWRSSPPSWQNDAWVRFLRNHWADASAAAGVLAATLTTCAAGTAAQCARLHLTCGQAKIGLAFAVGVAGWLVLEAKTSEHPDA